MRIPLIERLADRTYTADVGLVRLRAAGAATITTFATVLALLGLSGFFDAGLGFVIPGVLLTAVSTMVPGLDAEPRHRLGTMLLAPLAGAAGLALATLVTGNLVWTAVAFMALVVVTLLGALTGPRGIVMGLTAVTVFYGADLVGVQAIDAPAYGVGVVAAGVIAVLVLGVMFRDRPEVLPVRTLRSLDLRLARVEAAAAAGDGNAAAKAVARVSAATSAARMQIEQAPHVWPTGLREHSGAALGDLDTHLRNADTDPLDLASLTATARESRHHLATWAQEAERAAAHPPPPAGNVAGDSPVPPPGGGRSQVSMALQLLVATGLALVVSMTISHEKWFWGVLAALVMLFGTSSVAEAVGKGARRALGTTLALPAALTLSHLLGVSVVATVLGMVIAMFLQQYFADVAYGVSVFFLTIFLSLVFSLSGGATTDALMLRVIETVAGGVIGTLVALFVLPTRTGALLRGRAVDVVDAAGVTVRLLTDGESQSMARAAWRQTEVRFEQLHADAQSARRGWPFSRAHRITAQRLAAAGVAVRQLQELVGRSEDAPTPKSIATMAAATSELQAIADFLRRPPAGQSSTAAPTGPATDPGTDPVTDRATDPSTNLAMSPVDSLVSPLRAAEPAGAPSAPSTFEDAAESFRVSVTLLHERLQEG